MAEKTILNETRQQQEPLFPTKRKQWFDSIPQNYKNSEKATTTILFGGLTLIQDTLIEGALKGLGYKVQALDCPDNESLRIGREFGNRGQCNPTYFTVGNLIKHLRKLEEKGLSKNEIITNYLFLTSGSCGPCRFGTYVTEYRKALRDAGFNGFRVFLFQQQDGIQQATGAMDPVTFNVDFFNAALRAVIIGDIINLLSYRIRPYEVKVGATEIVVKKCKQLIYEAFSKKKALVPVLLKCRKEFQSIKVDWTQVKPKVSVIGEFWAMTTEGDGNYELQHFLENEGAEVEIQTVTSWLLYLIWEVHYDTKRRLNLRKADGGRHGLEGKNPFWRLLKLWAADRIVRTLFQTYAKTIGLHDYELPNMDELAQAANEFYDNHLRGGEGHMEVGKFVLNAANEKVNMTISVKPFGCMPSSGVSDGIQSKILEKYPNAIFLPIETTGDGAINVYSRIQMMLFKAKQTAQKEFEEALEMQKLKGNQTMLEKIKNKHHSLQTAKRVKACTAANFIYKM